MKASSACPCGLANTYAACCGRLHAGTPADTAEQLMRSRYSAYVLGLSEYVLASWHPDTRPANLDDTSDTSLRWLGLKIKKHAVTGPETAIVEFVARYRDGANGAVRLHETSRFSHVDGRWYYLDGDLHSTAKLGR